MHGVLSSSFLSGRLDILTKTIQLFILLWAAKHQLITVDPIFLSYRSQLAFAAVSAASINCSVVVWQVFPVFDHVFVEIVDSNIHISPTKFDFDYSRKCREMKPKFRR